MIQLEFEYVHEGNWNKSYVELDVDKHMTISEDNLDDTMCNLPQLQSYYADLASQAKFLAARKKQNLEAVESEIYLELRKSSTERLTEPHVRAKIVTDSRYKEAALDYYKADKQFSMLEGFSKALKDKANLSVALCYKQKEEIKAMNSTL